MGLSTHFQLVLGWMPRIIQYYIKKFDTPYQIVVIKIHFPVEDEHLKLFKSVRFDFPSENHC